MSSLTDARDHARRMQHWVDPREKANGRIAAWCLPLTRDGQVVEEPRHERCGDSADWCACSCHPRDPGPSAAERVLWGRIADEIDAHLGRAAEDEAEGLFDAERPPSGGETA